MKKLAGKLIYMRRGRVGVETSEGRIYYANNLTAENCPYEHGSIVKACLVDEDMSIVEVIDSVNPKLDKR